jgi:transcriptional regulator with PAS, ATPase and Fis domain
VLKHVTALGHVAYPGYERGAMARRATAEPAYFRALRAATEEVCGAALILDAELHVVLATPAAEALLGFEVPVGALAPKLLCGESSHRPVAEALAAGRPTQAIIPRPTKARPELLVRVRSVPLVTGRTREGWLLFLEEAVGAASEGAIEFHGMWTQDGTMKQVFRVLQRVADSDAPVLVRGETGAGKELIANAVHALSVRRGGPFRALNCAALPPNLLESELFGHARGAFTGAVKDEPGHLQLAHRGTLFLDEVAEMPLELQAKLLRVLETHTVLPVGARHPVPVDVRIVSATHRALRKEVEAGRFRADLMFRLRVIPIFLPPLRARRGDVALLLQRFIEERNLKGPRRVERIAPVTARILEAYDWPGNIRELRNVIEYAFAIGEGPILVPSDLPPELAEPTRFADDAPAPDAALAPPAAVDGEAARIVRALERSAGSRERAAKILGISRVTLWRRMKALGLEPRAGL